MPTKDTPTTAEDTSWWDATDDGSWTSIHADYGEALKLHGSAKEPDIFIGKLLSIEPREIVDNQTGEPKIINAFIFQGRDGQKYYMFENYALRQSHDDGKLAEGSIVRLTHRGKKELDNGQSVNRLDVEVRS